MMTTTHKCHATDCSRSVSPKMLMCRKHWYMVDKPLRDKVWEEYQPGQEINKNPTYAYLLAAEAAIECVRRKEARIYD